VCLLGTALLLVPPAALDGREFQPRAAAAIQRVPLKVERPQPGAPVTFGVPLPVKALDSPDHVRILSPDLKEIPSQITEVASWEPQDASVKWIWVFFFTTASADYLLEFGPGVRRAPLTGPRVTVYNNQRTGGGVDVETGVLKFNIRKGDGPGFFDRVLLDAKGDGFAEEDLVATGPEGGRGSFLDLVNDEGPDRSKAWVRRTLIERGSGPLHAIVRVEGEYRYGKPGHAPAPFTTRVHAYAGRSFVKVEHTFIYTGNPDKHRKAEGEHDHIATAAGRILPEDPADKGWMEPDDRVSAAGLALDLEVSGRQRATTAIGAGRWWESAEAALGPVPADLVTQFSLVQTGPKPARIPPVPESTTGSRLTGFGATFSVSGKAIARGERAPGWLSIDDGSSRALTIAIPRMLEEYPKALAVDGARASAYIWPPDVEPMSFARYSSAVDREEETAAIENNAQGTAKTTDIVFDFHPSGAADGARLRQFLAPPVAHADPAWYGHSGAFGFFAARNGTFPEYRRALDVKFDWMLFNQRWMPWYGMWDYGDWRLYFDGHAWTGGWGNNEPGEDFICWLQFMQTGDARVFDAARANSRHSMDVDNVHWPKDPEYLGDSNSALDYWKFAQLPKGSPYVGIGARHAPQHWSRTLSAHVWAMGWIADYFLAADHRGLDVAVQTADMHLKRIWGEHGLTGRRLYLALWNLLEVYDATKEPRYRAEIDDLVARILKLAGKDQGDSLTVDRYGYADVYVTHALDKYRRMTGDARVTEALKRHARRQRDVPPLNHEMESYFASVHALVLGYELTREPGLLAEIRTRIARLAMDPVGVPFDGTATQAEVFQAIDKASRLPRGSVRRRGQEIWSATNGLRVFGWTHAYTLPFALELLEHLNGEGLSQPLVMRD
jgi:hypothetical protein